MNDLMIDLETLSLKPNATILTIGAVMFEPLTGETGAELHIGCCFSQDRDVDINVMDWWNDPKQKAAKAELVSFLKQTPYRLDLALEKLTRFINKHKPKQIWGNSPSFDLAILTDAYRQHDMPLPWPFWIERDCRTLLNTCRQITGIDAKKEVKFDGISHSALADAIYQAGYVSKAYQLLARQYKPLSLDLLLKCYDESLDNIGLKGLKAIRPISYARAIEKAHGIGVLKEIPRER